jgi:DNA sulfur modification protein DndD
MLYLKKAKIKNFRQLRDIEIDFGLSEEKPLTVIRAENRTGKTTFLTALTWALFGNDALKSRKSYRMHPLDWSIATDGSSVDISVEIHFTNEDEETLNSEDYIVKRECQEILGSDGADTFTVVAKDPELYKLTESGNELIPNPNAYITKRLFPLSLKDIFITDGDKTLSFIDSEDTSSNRKDRVKKAVRSLMQLEALERAHRHLKEIRAEINRTLENNSSSGSVEKDILKQYNAKELELSKLPDELDAFEEDRASVNELIFTLEDDLHQAYVKAGGDPERKAVELERLRKGVLEEKSTLQEYYSSMSDYLKHNIHMFYAQFCKTDFDSLQEVLSGQIAKGVIPDVMPQIVRDRLLLDTCICGLKLSEHPDIRKKFEKLSNETSDSEQTMFLLGLKYDMVNWSNETNSNGFVGFRESTLKSIYASRRKLIDLDQSISELSTLLDQTKDLDLNSLRTRLSKAKSEEKELADSISTLKSTKLFLESQLEDLKKKKDQILKREGKRNIADDRLTAVDDMLRIINKTIHTLGDDTLREVSDKMNDIFHKINVQDGNSDSVIQSVSISPDHEITVGGMNNKRLVPSTDISGAQKRALTLAFIFATVQVSGRELPNVIDTPLGTQSGELKRLMLEYTALNTRQAVLFLTTSELSGVEDVVRKYTSKYWTLSHADHYPNELVNAPPVSTKSAYLCACDIGSSCELCARRGGVIS